MSKTYRKDKKIIRTLVNMQVLHGKIKGQNYIKAERIMELGAGKLNDLLNWADKKIDKVYAIELDLDSIEQGKEKYNKYFDRRKKQMTLNKKEYNILKKRRKLIPNLPEIQYIRANVIDDTDNIIKELSQVKRLIDHIYCNFSIHYFLKDKNSVNNLIKLINFFLKPSGTFTFTTIDGKILYDQFNMSFKKRVMGGKKSLQKTIEDKIEKDKNIKKIFDIINIKSSIVQETSEQVLTNNKNNITIKHNGKIYFKLERLYDPSEIFMDYGQAINVYVISIGKSHKEYLVNLNYIIYKFKKSGYILSNFKRFTDYMKELSGQYRRLSQAEYKYSSMNVMVNFTRIK